jgi:GTP-binding protein HflX
MEAVEKVLQDIKVEKKNILIVFNKTDKIYGNHFLFTKKKLINKYPDSVFISAKTGEGIDQLYSKIEEFLQRSKKCVDLEIPFEMQSLMSFLQSNAEIIESKYNKTTNSRTLKLKISRQLLDGIKKQIEDFNLLRFIDDNNIYIK